MSSAPPSPLPEGVVTFLFTDVEGSTRLWELDDASMRAAMVLHDSIIEDAAADAGGAVVKSRGEGDSRFLVFHDAADAVRAAVAIQRGLAAEVWPTSEPVRVRIGIHTGSAQLRDNDYYGSTVNRCARLRSIGHGGQTLISQATCALSVDALPTGVVTIDLGEHRLKDLARPEHVYQLVVDGLPSSFPPVESLAAFPNNLPVQLTELIGRDRECEELTTMLESRRLVTILAPGGTGKTRLVLQVAAEVASRFPNGVFFVPLAPISHSNDVVIAVAEAVGFRLSGKDDPSEQLLAYLHGKRQLLVLDNFEHVLGASKLVSAMLAAAPELHVLVTSRSRLDIVGETVFVLGGLSSDVDPGAGRLSSAAAQLFVDAATRRRPDLALRDRDLEPLDVIIGVTQGMPLALLLAAAWVDVLSLDEIADEVSKSADFLEAEMADLPERHRSVRAAFDSSWRMLDTREQALFGQISVFRGGFTRQAAEAVAGATLRDLSRLAGNSLLTVDRDTGRFSCHELLRQFGEEHLDHSGRGDETRTAFVGYFARAARDISTAIRNQAHLTALALLESDLENFRAAWRLGAGTGQVTHDLVFALWYYYELRNGYLPAVEFFRDGADRFAAAGGAANERLARLGTSSAAWFLSLLGRTDEALATASPVRDAMESSDDAFDLAFATHACDISLLYRSDTTRLIEESERAAERASAAGENWWELTMLTWKSHGLMQEGRYEESLSLLDTIAAQWEPAGELWGMIWVHEGYAAMARAQGRLAAARLHYGRELETARELGHLRSTQYALNDLGLVSEALGDGASAIGYFLEALHISYELGQTQETLGMLCDLARVRIAAGDPVGAAEIVSVVLDHERNTEKRRFDSAPVRELATAIIECARSVAGDNAVAAAVAAGRARGFKDTVEMLLEQPTARPAVRS
jgi:predicted ATPase